MKAIVIAKHGGPEALEYREIPDLVPGPDDLLVRVRATALNRADLQQRRGSYPQPGAKPAFEIPGLEFAGEVTAMGERVTGFALEGRLREYHYSAGQLHDVLWYGMTAPQFWALYPELRTGPHPGVYPPQPPLAER